MKANEKSGKILDGGWGEMMKKRNVLDLSRYEDCCISIHPSIFALASMRDKSEVGEGLEWLSGHCRVELSSPPAVISSMLSLGETCVSLKEEGREVRLL